MIDIFMALFAILFAISLIGVFIGLLVDNVDVLFTSLIGAVVFLLFMVVTDAIVEKQERIEAEKTPIVEVY